MQDTVVWWKSRVIWSQIIALLVGIAALFGIDVKQFGFTEDQVLGFVLFIVGLIGGHGRLTATKLVTLSKHGPPVAKSK